MPEIHINPDQNLTGKIDVGYVYPTLETLEVTPTTENQLIYPERYGFSQVEVEAVTSDIDNNIQENNIRKDIEILGITGTLEELNAQEKTATPSTSQQIITPDNNYNSLSQVTIEAVTKDIDSDIKAENIKTGVDILGVVGTYDGLIGQEKTATPTTNQQVITPDEGYTGLTKVTINPVTSEIDEDIIANNIRKDVNILGVVGNVEEVNAQTKSVTPTTSQQTITPDAEYNALSEVVVGAVDSSIDSNIQSSNIKAGVSILGVQGNVEPDKPDQTKTANPSTQTQVITPDIGYELASVTINPVDNTIDEDIVATNIKSGVNILGVDGSVIEKVGQNKTATPSTGEQVVTPDTGYNALNQVTIEAIQTETKEVKSTTSQQTITPTSGKFIDEVVVNPIVLEQKSIIPSTQSQTILPTSGKDGISQINVSAMNLQSKSVPITENGTSIIVPDTGYDGLSEVDIDVNVPAPQPSLQSKSVTITENGTTNVSADSGYDGLSEVAITTNVSGGADLNDYFINSVQPGSSQMSGFAEYSIKKIPENLVIGQTYMNGLFTNLKAITSIPYFDTTGITGFRYFCNGCSELINVPIYNTASVLGPYGMSDMFKMCSKLSDESLNNILKMCIDATSFTGTKTLTNVGLDAQQKAKCQYLSNWNDFVNAGWSA